MVPTSERTHVYTTVGFIDLSSHDFEHEDLFSAWDAWSFLGLNTPHGNRNGASWFPAKGRPRVVHTFQKPRSDIKAQCTFQF